MKRFIGVFGLTACALGACSSDPKVDTARDGYRRLAVAEAGPGAEVLAVCGPFRPAEGGRSDIALPADGKFIAFIERADDTLFVRRPFSLVANPPVTPDPDMVAVDAQGRPIPASASARNTLLRERTTTPWSASFTAVVWRADAQGAPLGDDRETYAFSKSWFRNGIRAAVTIGGRTSAFIADCG